MNMLMLLVYFLLEEDSEKTQWKTKFLVFLSFHLIEPFNFQVMRNSRYTSKSSKLEARISKFLS